MALATLVAGVTYNAQAIYLRPFDNGALADWSMNGGQNRNNEFLLDGAPNNANQGGNNIAYVPPADAVQEFKMQTNSYDAQYGRTAGGVINMSLKSGTNSFHGTGYEYYRRKWLDANSFLLNARGTPKVEHYLDQYGFESRRPGGDPRPLQRQEQDVLHVQRREVPRGHAGRAVQQRADAAMRNGDFSKLVDAQGRPIIIYDPATGRDVNGVWTRDPFPGNIIPANRIDPGAKACMQYYPAPNCTTPGQPDWQQNLCYTEHFNKDMFWNWVGKVDHNFSQKDRDVLPVGQEHAARGPEHDRHSQRPGAERPAAAPPRATMRSSATGCTSSAAARCSMCAAATPTTWRAASPITPSASTRRSSAGRRVSSSQLPAASVGGMFPVVTRTISSRSRAASGQTRTRTTPSSRTSRSRAAITTFAAASTSALHQRLQRRTTATRAGRSISLAHLHPQHAEQHQHLRRQCLRVVPARRAVRRQRARQPVPTLLWTFVAPWIQDDWRIIEQADAEPRFPVGLQQPGS